MSSDKDTHPLLHGSAGAKHAAETPTCSCREMIGRIFLNEHNPAFAINAELALRAAIGISVLGLPFLVPDGVSPLLDSFSASGFYKVGVITFFILNVGRTLGATVSSCFGSLRGLTVAVLHTWVLYFFFPRGVTDDSPPHVFWIGVADGAVFITTVLLLNLNASTKTVSICNFVGWWMLFLKPGDDSFHFPGSDLWDPWKDTGLAALLTMALGACLAIIGSALPYPVLAVDNAKDSVRTLISQMSAVWILFSKYMSEEQRSPYMQDQVFRNLHRLSALSTALPTELDHSWWECFGLGRMQRVRRKLRRIDKMIKDSYDSIYGVWAASCNTDWGPGHTRLMRESSPRIAALIQAGEDLLNTCLTCSCDGVIGDRDEEIINLQLKKVREADEALCRTFRAARDKLGRSLSALKDESGIEYVEELALPHALVFGLSSWVHVIADFAENLVKSKMNPDVLPMPDLGPGVFASLVQGACGFGTRNFALRASMCLFTGFFLGFHGFKDLLAPYNAGVASTVAVLMSRFTGSAIVKNLGRVQGVVLGMVFGQIIHKVFISCAALSVIPLGIFVFTYTWLMIFIYHNGDSRSAYIGCLAAIFGVQYMLDGKCAPEGMDIAIDKVGAYNSITCNVVGCSLIVLMDIVFYPGRASEAAHTSLQDCFTFLHDAINAHFDKQVDMVRERNNDFNAAVIKAESLNEDARNEPRFWRTGWKQDAYESTTNFMQHMRFNLRSLECSGAENFSQGGPKHKVHKALLETKNFQAIGANLQKKVGIVQKLSTLFVHETIQRFPLLDDEASSQVFRDETDKLAQELISEICGQDFIKDDSSKTMREDTTCQVVISMTYIKAMYKELRNVQHVLLRAC